jgi:hypothetical protein
MKKWLKGIIAGFFKEAPQSNEVPKIDIAELSALWIEPDIEKSPVVYDTPHKNKRDDTPGGKREKKRAVRSEEDLSLGGEDSLRPKIDLEAMIFRKTKDEK